MNNSAYTYYELYREFCECNPIIANDVKDYRPWGSMSIVIWLVNGKAYKCKRIERNKFYLQALTNEEIDKKFNLS